MASVDNFKAAEAAMRRLLEENDMPQPDVVEYLGGSISLRWHEQKLEVVIDEIPMDEPPEETG